MISYIDGKLAAKDEGIIVVETGGIGYELMVSNNTLCSLPLIGESVRVWTYMVVKEDGISLIGFSDYEEKKLFLKLITVSGVGPKSALAVLSGVKLSELIISILKGNDKVISSIKGVGKKTAERIILELKDKLDVSSISLDDSTKDFVQNTTAIEEAAETLVSLGLSKNEAYSIAKSYATENDTVEDIITKSLRGLGR